MVKTVRYNGHQRRRARHRPAPLAERGRPASHPPAAQRCALAAELKLHSVSVLGSVWTLHHPRERHTQPRPESARQGTGTGATSQPSRSTQRSRARAAAHAALMQKAQAFRARSVLTSWSRAAGSERLAMQLEISVCQVSGWAPQGWGRKWGFSGLGNKSGLLRVGTKKGAVRVARRKGFSKLTREEKCSPGLHNSPKAWPTWPYLG